MKGANRLEKQIVVYPTDKSGKVGVCSPDAYEKMGLVHTAKDQEVSLETAVKMGEDLDCVTSMLIKVFNPGDVRGHMKRYRESYLGGEHPAGMTLLLKDHKPKDSQGPAQ